MKIIVSVKQVPARDSTLRVNGDGKWLDESDLTYEMNEPDAYALEEALQLKEKLGGEVIVLCAGPERARKPFAKPWRKAPTARFTLNLRRRISWMRWQRRSCWPKRSRPKSPDLILTGLQSDDLGYGQTGVVLAELLGFAHATIVMEVEPQGERDSRQARARRWLVSKCRAAAARRS